MSTNPAKQVISTPSDAPIPRISGDGAQAQDQTANIYGTTRHGDHIYGPERVFDPKVHRYKVLMAPLNIAGQPHSLVNGLRDQDVFVRLFQYTDNKFKFSPDLLLDPRAFTRQHTWQLMLDITEFFLNQDFDIHHYWHKTLLYNTTFTNFTGFDLPYVKSAGKTLVHRFTGWDLRHQATNLDWNPYSAFRYGYQLKSYTDDEGREKWLDYLRQFADAFVVVDHEMQQYCPEARIIPRSLRLNEWTYAPLENTDEPRLIHFPTDVAFKGTRLFRKAVDTLRGEGLKFRYEELKGMPNAQIRQRIVDSDIILDQLHLGWYGVGAMEGMAIGRPVVVYVNEELERRFGDKVPIANANPDNVTDVLRNLIKDYEWRKTISEQGRDFLVRHHDSHVVAAQTKALYDSLLPEGAPIKKVERPISIDWLYKQIEWSYRHPWRKMMASSFKKVAVTTGATRIIKKSPLLTKVGQWVLKKVTPR